MNYEEFPIDNGAIDQILDRLEATVAMLATRVKSLDDKSAPFRKKLTDEKPWVFSPLQDGSPVGSRLDVVNQKLCGIDERLRRITGSLHLSRTSAPIGAAAAHVWGAYDEDSDTVKPLT